MSYSIRLRVYQTNPNAFFNIIEKTVWNFANGGSWTESGGENIFVMGGSGTSGTLRFRADNGETFIVALGVHNYKRWCDIIPDLPTNRTGTTVNPQYYDGLSSFRESQRSQVKVTSSTGRSIQIIFTVADGNSLQANIIIG